MVERRSSKFFFLDGDNDPDNRDEGPVLRHFRSCVIQDIEKQSADIWKHIMDTNIKIPAEAQTVRIYDEDGEFVSYCNHHISEIEDEFENHQSDEMFDFSPIKNNSQSFSATPITECPTTSTPVNIGGYRIPAVVGPKKWTARKARRDFFGHAHFSNR